MRISNSAIKCFKSCRRMYELRYVYGLEPDRPTAAQERGLGYHDALEKYLMGEQLSMFEDNSVNPKTLAMVSAFAKYIQPQLEKMGVEVAATEQWVSYQTKSGNSVFGRVDGVLSDGTILEHKSTSGKIDGAYWNNLSFDEQMLTYMVACGTDKVFYTVCMTPTIRQKANEDESAFFQRCLDWYADDTESKISRMLIATDKERLEEFRAEQDAVIQEIDNCKLYYRNPSHCMKWGRMCEYAPICLQKVERDREYLGFKGRSEHGTTAQDEEGTGND